MDDIYKNTEAYNPRKNWKTIIVFDDTIVDMLSDKKLNPIVTTLFIRGRKLNISFLFITQFYLNLPKNIRLSSMDYSIMKLQTNESSKKLYLIFSYVLIFKIYTKDVL